MASQYLYIFGSVIIVSLISFIGVASFLFGKRNIHTAILFLVSFSAGALLGDAFIHIIPEAFKIYGYGFSASLYILFGILIFFALEKFIHWKHCHETGECDIHDSHLHGSNKTLIVMNLVGGATHNLTDGIIIGVSYLISIPLGVATTTAVVLHEIPHEFGDFAVLIHGGLSKKKALLYNFLSAIISVIGAVIAISIGNLGNGNALQILALIAAGGFIYIAGTDLIPELHKQNTTFMSILQLIGLLLGIGIMLLLIIIG